MNPDEFTWGKNQYVIGTNEQMLLGFTDHLEMVKFASWTDFHNQKRDDVFCIVVLSKHIFSAPASEKPYYIAEINDHRGVVPETEQNCSWYGSSYESMTAALQESLSKFAETHAFIDKVNTMIRKTNDT